MLSRQMKRAAPKPDATTLRQLAEFWLPPAGVESVKVPPASFYLVEYWAQWCAACKPMERHLGKWLADKPAPEVAWISVEEDLTSVAPGKAVAGGFAPKCPIEK